MGKYSHEYLKVQGDVLKSRVSAVLYTRVQRELSFLLLINLQIIFVMNSLVYKMSENSEKYLPKYLKSSKGCLQMSCFVNVKHLIYFLV